jgi:uncharacterized membrane protein
VVTFWSYLAVFGLSMLPIFELKGSIPVGLTMGIPDIQCFIIAEIGCIVLTPLIIMFTKRILEAFMNSKIKLLHRFGAWQHRRLTSKGGRIGKYKMWFLFIFVAIPLPTTGVWTGSMIAGLFDMRIKKAVPVIFLGNIVAGLLIWLIWGFATG